MNSTNILKFTMNGLVAWVVRNVIHCFPNNRGTWCRNDLFHGAECSLLDHDASKIKYVADAISLSAELTLEKKPRDQQEKWIAPLGPIQAVLQLVIYSLIKIIVRVVFRFETVGLENIPEDVQVVFIPNHASYIDAFLLAASLPYRRLRRLQWAGWAGIAFSNAFCRGFSRLVQGIPIDADHVFSSLRLAEAVLTRRRSLVWFPEGGCTRTSELQTFKGGIGILLEHFPEVLVVPVFLKNTGKALAPGSWRIHPVKLEVIFGVPQLASELQRDGIGDTPRNRILSALYMAVRRLDSRQDLSVPKQVE